MAEDAPVGRRQRAPAWAAHGDYRPDIDGLRALAVVPVLLFHAGVAGFSGGFVGVDVFFVISGFVIAASINRDLQAQRFSLAGFYERRVRRILPALTVIALATALVSVWLAPPFLFRPFAESLSYTALFSSNLYFLQDVGYFNTDLPFRPLLHTWSLGVEEQYYLIAPLALWFVHACLQRRWRLALAPLAAASFLLAAWAVDNRHFNQGFYLLPMRAWELLLGVLVALAPLKLPSQPLWRNSIAAAGLALIALPVYFYSEQTAFPGLAAAPPCLGAAALLAVGAGEAKPWATRALSQPAFVGVGLISYSLYLVHWPLLVLTGFWLLRRPDPFEMAALIAACFALAALSYRFIETPARRVRAPRSLVLALGALSVVLVAAAGVMSPALNARIFADRPEGDYAPDRTALERAFRTGDCLLYEGQTFRDWDPASCTLGAGEHPPTLLWGDSFAAHYAPGLEAVLTHPGAGRVMQYSMQGCPPLLSNQNTPCAEFARNALDLIAESGVRRVVIAASWFEYEERRLDDISLTLAALARSGAEVTVIGQSPFFLADPFLFIARRGSTNDADVWMRHDARGARINAELRERAIRAGAEFVDPIGVMCAPEGCPVRTDGVDRFADYGHFTVAGSALAVRAYFPYVPRSGGP